MHDTLGAMPTGPEVEAAAANDLPSSFGKYFLTEKLATGGMAEIYLAKIVGPGGFEKQLVIKQIHPRLSGQRHFVDLFVAEAKTLVTLAHGNIVPVYELGVIDDTYFIAMEYIDGPTLYRLTERLSRRDEHMSPQVAAWITARILEGLDYAHRKGEGVIHRDLSPRNVMLSRDGEVKLVDFGIAITRGTDDTTEEQSAPTGSFPYMSPEQVRRDPLNQQSDLFSVGVLMWEMLVGQRLFARSTADDTLAAVTTTEIAAPSSIRPEIPAKLDEVVMRALERDMTARWPTAGDMLAALQKYLYALDETPTPRDVAALVAMYCPPETRRLPTHAEPMLAETPPPAGPHTAVIPRKRHQTFATHIELQTMLSPPKDLDDRATAPVQAIVETVRPVEPDDAAAADDDDVVRLATPPPRPPPERDRPPSRALLVVAGLGATGLAIGAILVFLRGRAAVLAPDAAPKFDAAWYSIQPDAEPNDAAIDAAIDAPGDAPADAPIGPFDAAIADAPIAHATRDAAGVRLDAAIIAPHPAGTATLKCGADPWADIWIDGVKRGHTPAEITVSAGHHVVELIYGGDDPPKKKSFAIDPAPNDVVPLQYKFER